jgi:hypothetical protein
MNGSMRITPKFAVLSVMGPHAGEDAEVIFHRKISDIQEIGETFWLIHSHKAKPDMIKRMCGMASYRENAVECLFIEPSSRGGAKPTKTDHAASEYSSDLLTWLHLPSGLSPVTGLITKNACALVFDQLKLSARVPIDLWEYRDFFEAHQPVRFRQGASTVCVVQDDMKKHPDRMKSNIRQVVAIGRLIEPYAVWLR